MANKWMKILSLAGEREDDIFREEKIQKERNLSRGPMTKGHLSERSFLDLRGHFSNLIQMREIGTKKNLLVGNLLKCSLFF